MKFLLELVTCCGSCSSGTEGRGLLVMPETRRRVGRSRNNRGRLRGGRRKWRPSLSSISEDGDLVAERINNIERTAEVWRRRLKRKVSSMLQRDRARSLDYDDRRRGRERERGRGREVSMMVPAFAPTPFMF